MRFYSVVYVDPAHLGRIGQQIIVHLSALKDANITVTVEIQAEGADGIEHPIFRAVSENCRC